MSRFLFVNQHYWPDFASTGQHLTDLAEHLVEHGHEVRVLCAKPSKADQSDDAKAALAKAERNGVEIQRIGTHLWVGSSQRSLRSRACNYLGFHLRAAPRLLCSRWPDAVVTLTSPPMLGVWSSFARRWLGGPKHAMFLMDHHPDAEFALGLLSKKSLQGRFLEWLYASSLRGADRCVSLGPYQDQRVAERQVPQSKRAIVPIWTRQEDVAPIEHTENPLRESMGWQGRFVVLYSGNAGWVHRFDELCEAMLELQTSEPRILFAFVGGGPRRVEIENFAKSAKLSNARFYDYLPREALRHSLPAADAHFLSLRPEQVGVSVPSKLYGQLASGRPVLFVGPRACESADDLRDSGAGFGFEPGQSAELALQLRELANDPELCTELGQRGRAWFLSHRERKASCEAWREVLEDLSGHGQRTASKGLQDHRTKQAKQPALASAQDSAPMTQPKNRRAA